MSEKCQECGRTDEAYTELEMEGMKEMLHAGHALEMREVLDALEALRNAGTLTDLPTGRFKEIIQKVDDVLLAHGRKVPERKPLDY